MRVTILSLFLYGTTAFCQSSAPAPVTAENLDLIPQVLAPAPSRDFTKLPPGWHAMSLPAPKIMMVPNARDTTRLSNSEIDPKLIVHPPLSILGAQPPGIAMTQSEYPNLQTLPIDSTNSALEAIPIMWPRYRLETIPTQWPRHEMVPVRSGFEVTARSPGN